MKDTNHSMNSERQNQKNLHESPPKSSPLSERETNRLLACCRMIKERRRMAKDKAAVEALK